MHLFHAEELAEQLRQQMAPYCQQIQIAGSIRRQRPNVKDIEIVAVPRWEQRPDPSDLFGGEIPVNALYADWAQSCGLTWLKGCKPEGKQWVAELPEGIQLDLYLPKPDNWGWILALRTGCAEYSQALVVRAKATFNHSPNGGYLLGRDGRDLETPTERDVFRLLGVPYLEPEARDQDAAARLLRSCHTLAA